MIEDILAPATDAMFAGVADQTDQLLSRRYADLSRR